MNWSDFYNKISDYKKVLLVLPELIDYDVACGAALIFKILKEKGVKVDIGFSGKRKILNKLKKIFELADINVDHFINHIQPVYYNFVIKNVDKNSKLDWYIDSDNLHIKIVSEKSPIDFGFVDKYKDGGIYDIIVTLNINTLNDIGKLFTSDADRLLKFDIFVFGYNDLTGLGDESNYKINFVNLHHKCTSYGIIKSLNNFNIGYDEVYAQIAMIGMLWYVYGLMNYDYELTDLINTFSKNLDIDINQLSNQYIDSLNSSNIKLKELFLKNLKFDDIRNIAYSSINSKDLVVLGVNFEEIDFWSVFNFNLDKKYQYCFLLIENNNELTTVYIKNNNLSSNISVELIKLLNGVSNYNYGFAEIKDNIFNSINKILNFFSSKSSRGDFANVNNNNNNNSVVDTSSEVLNSLNNSYNDSPNNDQNNSITSNNQNNQNVIHTNFSSNVAASNGSSYLQSDLNNNNYHNSSHQGSGFVSNDNRSTINVPNVQSPFKKADLSNIPIDTQAEPLKKSDYFSSMNPPFDKSTS